MFAQDPYSGYAAPDFAGYGSYGEPDYAGYGAYAEPDYSGYGSYGEPDYAGYGLGELPMLPWITSPMGRLVRTIVNRGHPSQFPWPLGWRRPELPYTGMGPRRVYMRCALWPGPAGLVPTYAAAMTPQQQQLQQMQQAQAQAQARGYSRRRRRRR